jgi:ribulose bisphosphate carboxylase small subunit
MMKSKLKPSTVNHFQGSALTTVPDLGTTPTRSQETPGDNKEGLMNRLA